MPVCSRMGFAGPAATGRAAPAAAPVAALAAALALALLAAAASPAAASSAARDRAPAEAPTWPGGPPVALHAAMGDTVDAAEAARFGILTGIDDLRWAVFLRAPWGGHVMRFALAADGGTELRERNVPATVWAAWRERIEAVLAGLPPPPRSASEALPPGPDEMGAAVAGADSAAGGAGPAPVWPEAPLPPPPPAAATAGAAAEREPEPLPDLADRWYALVEVGYRRDVSDFRQFFGDMAMLGLTLGPMVGRLMPWLHLEAAFGDLPDDFEKEAGDGTTTAYGVALGLSLRQPLSRRVGVYAAGGYGYFHRAIQWGGPFVDPYGRSWVAGDSVGQQDWGTYMRLGVQLQRGGERARFWDLGVSLQSTPAEAWGLTGPEGDTAFLADGPDTWLTVSLRLGESI